MDAYETFLQQTVGPAVKLRDYIIDLKKQVERNNQDAERYRALKAKASMSLPSPEGCDSPDAYLVVTGYGNERDDIIIDQAVDETMKCQHCDGFGVMSYNPNLNPNDFKSSTTAKCPHCNGTGTI